MTNGRPTNVIYGDVGSFQRDFLQTEFKIENIIHADAMLDTGKRGKHVVIIDEVDSMLLDNANVVLYLSHSIESLRTLEKIFIEIWRVVNEPDLVSAGPHDENASCLCFLHDLN